MGLEKTDFQGVPGYSPEQDDFLHKYPNAGSSLVTKLSRLHRVLARMEIHRAQQELGLLAVESRVVMALEDFVRPVSIRTLAMLASLDAAQVSRAVSKLAERAWLVRRRSERDQRLAEVILTEEGKARVRAMRASATFWTERLLEGLDKKEVAGFQEMLDVLLARAIREAEDDSSGSVSRETSRAGDSKSPD